MRAVHSIKIVMPLADATKWRLRERGHADVAVHRGDGDCGVPQAVPFDGIMVTAVAGSIPSPLLGQIGSGERG